ncbi:MAG: DMT family transporter [Bacteroidales bacterium]|nr:DMT family transporter [Bacteroidales bacterium]
MNNSKAYISVIGAMIFWSLSFIWSKQALETYGPLTILFSRLVLASVALLSVSKIFGKLNKIAKEDWKYLLLLSLFEPFLYFIGETYGLQRVSPTIAAVIISTIPLFLPIVGFYFLNEKLTIFKVSGTLLSFIGVILVMLNYNMELKADAVGVLLLFLAVFSGVAYTTLVHRLSNKYNSFTIVGWQSAIGAISFMPLFMLIEMDEAAQIGIVWESVWPIIKLGLFASIFAFVLYTYSIKELGITKAGVFSNVIPVFVSIISFFLFSERLLVLNYIGILVVVGGLFISQVKRR